MRPRAFSCAVRVVIGGQVEAEPLQQRGRVFLQRLHVVGLTARRTGDGQQTEGLAAGEALPKLGDMRQFIAAGWTPRAPKIQQRHMIPDIRQRDCRRVAGQGPQFQKRQRLAHARMNLGLRHIGHGRQPFDDRQISRYHDDDDDRGKRGSHDAALHRCRRFRLVVLEWRHVRVFQRLSTQLGNLGVLRGQQ